MNSQISGIASSKGVSYAAVVKSTCSISTQTDLTWPKDSKVPVHTTGSISTAKTTETQTCTDADCLLGAVGGKPTARSNVPEVPLLCSSPKQKTSQKPDVKKIFLDQHSPKYL